MKAGKLPAELLSRLLATLPADSRTIIGPGVGRDAAAIDLGNGQVLVAKSDPVTFATDRIGRYVVNVNANDVACLGARPTLFLATALLPEGAPVVLAETIFLDIRDACVDLGIACVGGHIEVTLGLDRPIIAGTMLGETTLERLVRPEDARAGDHIILTKGIAIEGTALLARDASEALLERGVDDGLIDRAAGLLDDPGISVVREALAACDVKLSGQRMVHAMHDPTEGGFATAVAELCTATGLGSRLRLADVHVLPETSAICQKLGLDPLGLLASGALLIVVSPDGCSAVREEIERSDTIATCIGELARGDGTDIIDGQAPRRVPRFERDELARFLEGLSARAQG